MTTAQWLFVCAAACGVWGVFSFWCGYWLGCQPDSLHEVEDFDDLVEDALEKLQRASQMAAESPD